MSTDLLTIESTIAYRAPTSRPVKAEEGEHDEAGSTKTLGLSFYLMSDCLLFAFAYVIIETVCLRRSSFRYRMAMLKLTNGRRNGVLGWLAVTFLLGLC